MTKKQRIILIVLGLVLVLTLAGTVWYINIDRTIAANVNNTKATIAANEARANATITAIFTH